MITFVFQKRALWKRNFDIYHVKSVANGMDANGTLLSHEENKSFYQEIIRKIPKTIILGYYTKLSSQKPF